LKTGAIALLYTTNSFYCNNTLAQFPIYRHVYAFADGSNCISDISKWQELTANCAANGIVISLMQLLISAKQLGAYCCSSIALDNRITDTTNAFADISN